MRLLSPLLTLREPPAAITYHHLPTITKTPPIASEY